MTCLLDVSIIQLRQMFLNGHLIKIAVTMIFYLTYLVLKTLRLLDSLAGRRIRLSFRFGMPTMAHPIRDIEVLFVSRQPKI